MKTLRVGTRGSELAKAQTALVCERLKEAGFSTELVFVRTAGDRDQASPFRRLGPDIFTRALDEALLCGRIDCAVHSAKDVPTSLPAGVEVCAFTERAFPEDALVFFGREQSLDSLPEGARVGTSSLRRAALLRHLRSDLTVEGLRGNVRTRLRTAGERGLQACVLARAGLERLGLGNRIGQILDPKLFVPQAGQGALAVTARSGDTLASELRELLDDVEARTALRAEREYLRRLGGGCQVPAGAYCRVHGEEVELTAVLLSPDGSCCLKAVRRRPASQAESLGRLLAEELLTQGGEEIIRKVKSAE